MYHENCHTRTNVQSNSPGCIAIDGSLSNFASTSTSTIYIYAWYDRYEESLQIRRELGGACVLTACLAAWVPAAAYMDDVDSHGTAAHGPLIELSLVNSLSLSLFHYHRVLWICLMLLIVPATVTTTTTAVGYHLVW